MSVVILNTFCALKMLRHGKQRSFMNLTSLANPAHALSERHVNKLIITKRRQALIICFLLVLFGKTAWLKLHRNLFFHIAQPYLQI